jgi:hypothetical protein
LITLSYILTQLTDSALYPLADLVAVT